MNAGSWSAVMPWPLIGIHAALLPDGRVLTFGSDQRGEQGLHKIYDIWDPKTGVHLTTTDAIATDEFCSAGSSTRSPMIWLSLVVTAALRATSTRASWTSIPSITEAAA